MPDKKEIVHGSRRTRLVVALALFAIVIFLSVALSRVFFRDYALKKEIAHHFSWPVPLQAPPPTVGELLFDLSEGVIDQTVQSRGKDYPSIW